ncbi:hypothetical protein, partial [Streptomyces niveus]|uniref:hypothetical protein n=1 Tax=Streptomyces niveus TaxID=193462 RepID=UPI003F4E42C1
ILINWGSGLARTPNCEPGTHDLACALRLTGDPAREQGQPAQAEAHVRAEVRQARGRTAQVRDSAGVPAHVGVAALHAEERAVDRVGAPTGEGNGPG